MYKDHQDMIEFTNQQQFSFTLINETHIGKFWLNIAQF